MNRRERLLLLVFFGVVLVLLVRDNQTSTLVGGVTGAVVAVVAAGRLSRLSHRMDERLGADPVAVTGWSWRRPARRAVAHLAVLAGLLLLTVFVPFVGDQLFAGAAAAVTALPAVLTASRLRR